MTNYLTPERGLQDLAGTNRRDALMSAMGYYAENYPRASTSSTAIMVTGTVYYLSIGLAAGDVVANICSVCNTLGSGFSGINMRAGLYNKALVLVASTGDISAAYGSTGPKASPVTTPYVVPTTDAYYVALLAVATTPPVLNRSAAAGTFGQTFPGGTIAVWGTQAAQTDLPVTPTIATSGAGYWVAVS